MNLKKYEIDFDSLDECKKLLNKMKSRIGELNSSECMSKSEKKKLIFDSCLEIYNKDISSIYDNLELDTNPIYYVYAHCDPKANIAVGKCGKTTFGASIGLNKIPFYIGKGTGNRAFDLNRSETHRKIRQKIQTFGDEIQVNIIKDGLTEIEALMLESKLIDIFGLKSFNGFLVNLDEGINKVGRRSLYKEHLVNLNLFYKNSV